jgi:hypothetical protein
LSRLTGPTCCRCQPMFLTQSGNGCYGLRELDVPNPAVDCSTPEKREIFVHSATAQASGLAKRRSLAEQRSAREADTSLCPAGSTACRVPNTIDGYEVRLRPLRLDRQPANLKADDESPCLCLTVPRHANRTRVVRRLPLRRLRRILCPPCLPPASQSRRSFGRLRRQPWRRVRDFL